MRSLRGFLAVAVAIMLGVMASPTVAYSAPGDGPNFLESSHVVSCGQVTISLRNVSPWIYPMSVYEDAKAVQYRPVVDNRTGGTLTGPQKDVTRTTRITFPEDSGVHTVRYRVEAGSENRLYRGLPVGEFTEVTVQSDCLPNTVAVTPVEAVVTQPTCDADASVTIPTTEGVQYRINGGDVVSGLVYPLNPDGTNVMTAVALEGFRIEGEFSQSIVIEEAPDCRVVAVPVEAVFTQPTCDADASVTIPTTDGVQYRINGGDVISGLTYPLNPDGTNVMTAVALEGFRIEGEFSQSIVIEEAPDCRVVPVPVEAVFTQPTCDADASVTIPTTEGVDYLFDGEPVVSDAVVAVVPGSSHVLTAVAQEGFKIEGEFSQSIVIGDAPSFLECNPKPEPVVTTEERVVTDCSAGTTTTFLVTTTTDWVLSEDGVKPRAVEGRTAWVPGEPVVTEKQVGSRPATAEECPVVEPSPTPSVTPTPTTTPSVTPTPTTTPSVTPTPTTTPSVKPSQAPPVVPTVTVRPSAKPGLPHSGADGPSGLTGVAVALMVGAGALTAMGRMRSR